MAAVRGRIEDAIAPSLIDKVPRDHEETPRQFFRRRLVVAVAGVIGATLLGFSFSVPPGYTLFYTLTALVAVAWTVGGLLSGPLHLGYIPSRGGLRRPLVTPVVTALCAAGVFVAGALVVREIPPLRDYVESVLAHADRGAIVAVTVVTVVNAVAEEIFFRGALFAAVGRRYPVVISTVIYAVVTIATGNPMLVFAALTLGFVLGLQRRASGGVLAPILTHVVWSIVMLFALPPLFPH
jgi:membrane protease YdiL (CAAX protease family)